MNLDLDDAHRLFLRELDKLERQFAGYLNWLLEQPAADYESNARGLYQRILDHRNAGADRDDAAMVLSFNYTRPLRLPAESYANVHGCLEDNNILFGAALPDAAGDGPVSLFGKDERAWAKSQGRVDDVFAFLGRLGRIRDVSVVKVFGSSLGDVDYPWFSHLFDEAGVLEGRTPVEFLYAQAPGPGRPYSPEPLAEASGKLLDRCGAERGFHGPGRLSGWLYSHGKYEIHELAAADKA